MPLTPGQEEYFRILEELDSDGSLAVHIDAAKRNLDDSELAARRAEYEHLARTKDARRLMRRFRAWLTR